LGPASWEEGQRVRRDEKAKLNAKARALLASAKLWEEYGDGELD